MFYHYKKVGNNVFVGNVSFLSTWQTVDYYAVERKLRAACPTGASATQNI